MSGSSIQNLIHNLNTYKTQDSYLISKITDFDTLITSLYELDAMIEMDSLKDSIVKQIKFLLIKSVDNQQDTHMMNTVIYGPPGVGKTKISTILVKIWNSLGVLFNTNNSKSNSNSNSNSNSKSNSMNIADILNISGNYSDDNGIGMKDKITGNLVADLFKNIQQQNISNSESITTINRLQKITKALRTRIKINAIELAIIKTDLKLLDMKLDSQYKNPSLYEYIVQQNDISMADVVTRIENMEKQLEFHFESTKEELKNYEKTNVDANAYVPTMIILDDKSPSHIPTDKDLIKIVSREDFVGGYLGQTAIKTEKLLKDSIGKVLFIDEAYSLVNDERDSYGREAITVLNRFMSEHPNDIIVIFAGYKDLMENTIFKFQPGLKSRCSWAFEISGYTHEGLSQIFIKQLVDDGWKLSQSVDIENFFQRYKNNFSAFGRDTNKLLFYCKICYSEYIFDNPVLENNKVINNIILEQAIAYLQDNKIKDNIQKDINMGMYL